MKGLRGYTGEDEADEFRLVPRATRQLAVIEHELTLREALLLAVEVLRGGNGDRALNERAARMLDRKAMKLRAREEASVVLPSYCLCGEGKTHAARFCVRCSAAIPVKLWMAFHTAPVGKMAAAYEEITDFVKSRRVLEVMMETSWMPPTKPVTSKPRRGGKESA